MDSKSPSADFTAQDDAFFAEGDRLSEQVDESFEELDERSERPSLWDRLRRRRR